MELKSIYWQAKRVSANQSEIYPPTQESLFLHPYYTNLFPPYNMIPFLSY